MNKNIIRSIILKCKIALLFSCSFDRGTFTLDYFDAAFQYVVILNKHPFIFMVWNLANLMKIMYTDINLYCKYSDK